MITTYNTASSGAKSGSGNTALLVGLLFAGALAGYYFFIHKPEEERKQQSKPTR